MEDCEENDENNKNEKKNFREFSAKYLGHFGLLSTATDLRTRRAA